MDTPGDKAVVRLEHIGDVGLILVDHPPVNALSQAVRKGLIASLASHSDTLWAAQV